MKKGFVFVLLGAAFALFFVVLIWPAEREPEYQGKKLSELLRIYCDSSHPNATFQAGEDIRHIGTNALPCLLKWIEFGPSHPRYYLLAAVNKIGFSSNSALASLVFLRSSRLAVESVAGFEALGLQAKGSVPALARLLRGTNSYPSLRAMIALKNIAHAGVFEALPPLLNPNNPFRLVAVSFFTPGNLGTNSFQGLAMLDKCLKEQDNSLAMAVVNTLESDWREDSAAVPILVAALADSPTVVRARCALALAKFGKEANAAIPALTKLLDDPWPEARRNAEFALHKIRDGSKVSRLE